MNTHDSLTVAIFAKPPRPGESKTRLGEALGPESAARLAHAFLDDSLSQLSRFRALQPVLATTEPWPRLEFPIPDEFAVWQQGDGDLGARIERIMSRALENTQTAVALGADTPGLPEKLMVEAVHGLQANDAVLGRAEDGGFYLLGLRHCPPGLLRDLPWSQPNTASATQIRLERQGFSVARASPWFDIDTLRDLHRLQGLLEREVITAPRTKAALEAYGALPPLQSES
ncbi:MAG: TIGR04282 family arsenosugar biosynthesis glycosyltransferase [Myxococcota bacterium]